MKTSVSKNISSCLSLKGGSLRQMTLNLKYKSSLNLPSFTSSPKSLLVAATILASIFMDSLLPTRIILPSSITLNSFAWVESGISPISSRNKVPLFAYSNLPFLWYKAPVKAPFSCPNNSLSRRVSEIAAEFRATKGLFLREPL